jgi:type II secretory pathway pseudopilin PulG
MKTIDSKERSHGYSLAELAITLGIVAVAAVLAVPSLNRARQNGELRDSAQALNTGLTGARGEAMRTGDVHLFFVFQDAEGNPLVDRNGDRVAALVLNDGAPGSAGQNCRIDAGEEITPLSPDQIKQLTELVGHDFQGSTIGGATSNGYVKMASSFEDPQGNVATWVMFRPEGMPVSFDSDCNLGQPGSGEGGLYIKNEQRAFAIEMIPMGTTKVSLMGESTQTVQDPTGGGTGEPVDPFGDV